MDEAKTSRPSLDEQWYAFLLSVLALVGGLFFLIWHLRHGLIIKAELNGQGELRQRILALSPPGFDRTVWAWWPSFYLGVGLLALGGVVGAFVFSSKAARTTARASAWALVGLAVVHLVESLLEVGAAAKCGNGSCPSLRSWALGIQATSFVIYSVLPVAAAIAGAGACTGLVRMVQHRRNTRNRSLAVRRVLGEDGAFPCPSGRSSADGAGGTAYWRSQARLAPGDQPGGTGICLSGGGIRSASFSLGALQALQRAPQNGGLSELARSRYLAAVSGGSYIAGAFEYARRPRENSEGKQQTVPADDLFAAGSPEYDHLRHNCSYIAKNTREWGRVLFTVLRGALASLLFLGFVTFVVGRWVGHFYQAAGRLDILNDPWHPSWGEIAPITLLLSFAFLLWVTAAHLRGRRPPAATADSGGHRRDDSWRWLADAATFFALAAGLLFLTGAVIPVAAWASTAVGRLPGAPAAGGGTGVLGLIVGTFGLALSRRGEVKKLVDTAKEASKSANRLGDFGRRAVQWLAVYGGLAIITASYLLLFGAVVDATAQPHPGNHVSVYSYKVPLLNNIWLTIVSTFVLGLAYFLIDETSLGLHPFYRERLAHSFAVRRAEKEPRGESSRRFEADPYDPPEAAWAALAPPDPSPEELSVKSAVSAFPEVVFCAAAHSSSPDDALPGGRALPFTFSRHAVGGPTRDDRDRWCTVKEAQFVAERTNCRYARDLTVETAMAVSGAAFASATGRYSKPANVLLALANARLGTWVVNPAYVNDMREDREWFEPWLPKRRRLAYLLREIFGVYPSDGPLMFVTDGGHYESLGLLELLRHGCTEIYCFDATADHQSFAASLADSVALAYEELGVTFDFDSPDATAPGSGSDAPEDLKPRTAKSPLITGTFTYPVATAAERDTQQTAGRIVIGKATLDKNTPWEVQRYAAANPQFPYDATGDQFFGADRFDAYVRLGQYVGGLAADFMVENRASTAASRTGTQDGSISDTDGFTPGELYQAAVELAIAHEYDMTGAELYRTLLAARSGRT